MDYIIYNILTNNGFSHLAAINIIAQARHETGGYKSVLFNEYNNLFGYGFSGSKWQSSKSKPVLKNGEPANWAIYNTKTDSIYEIVDYWKRRLKEGYIKNLADLENTEKFAHVLKSKGYYTADYNAYLKALKQNAKEIDLTPPNQSILFSLFFFGIIAAIVLYFNFRK